MSSPPEGGKGQGGNQSNLLNVKGVKLKRERKSDLDLEEECRGQRNCGF